MARTARCAVGLLTPAGCAVALLCSACQTYTEDLLLGAWSNVVTDITGDGFVTTNMHYGASADLRRFYRLRLHF